MGFHSCITVANLFSHRNKEKIDSIGVLREENGQLPDLNPIEHLWQELERCIQNCSKHPKILELEIALQNEWAQIPEHVYIGLVKSMPR